MGRARWYGPIVAILGLGLAPALLASCGTSCSASKRIDATFVGQLTALHAATGAFSVEAVLPEPAPGVRRHVPSVGTSVSVRYADGQERFLRVGRRYRVSVLWTGAAFESGVHVADDPCSGGTTYADGSAIDTASVSWLRAHRLLTVLALVPVVVLLMLSAWIWSRRRRRPKAVRVDDRFL